MEYLRHGRRRRSYKSAAGQIREATGHLEKVNGSATTAFDCQFSRFEHGVGYDVRRWIRLQKGIRRVSVVDRVCVGPRIGILYFWHELVPSRQ
jgi:hypothetical protein